MQVKIEIFTIYDKFNLCYSVETPSRIRMVTLSYAEES